ncbi:MAG: hypothetical protein J7641_03435 [Cyanobacteria bacterium SID2]|nr:hypothetical protein [Cyanobacteria bacterium SID2]MBP0004078.1 hypothetical protein [Cyanobacteria bacterium SBC]
MEDSVFFGEGWLVTTSAKVAESIDVEIHSLLQYAAQQGPSLLEESGFEDV